MQAQLQQLMDKGSLWLGRSQGLAAEQNAALLVTTGQPVLDQALGGGWAAARVHELQCAQWFSGELALLAPAIARATACGRPVFWLAPPAIPYPPALAALHQQQAAAAQHIVVHPHTPADALWSAETILHSGQVAVLLLWAQHLTATEVRRLHLAAAATDAWVFVLTGEQNEEARSYATRLRVHLQPPSVSSGGVLAQVQWQLLKRQGGWPQRLPKQPLPRWRAAAGVELAE